MTPAPKGWLGCSKLWQRPDLRLQRDVPPGSRGKKTPAKQDAVEDRNHAEWRGLLVEREFASRNTRRFQTRMRSAKLCHIGQAIEDVDVMTPRKLDRNEFQQLATGRWIDDAHRREQDGHSM